MEIVVLVKKVPETASVIQIADVGNSIKDENLKWVMNPYDENAVEEALKLREAHGGKVTVLSLGPKNTEEVIRTSLAMGADEGVRIDNAELSGMDSLSTAKALAAALRQIPYDLVISGTRGVDYDHYQTAPAVAELLDVPQITQVISVAVGDGKVTCGQVVEGGVIEIESSLPALLTTQRGLNKPRYASLIGIMKAKKKPLHVRSFNDIGLNADDLGAKHKIFSLSFPPKRQPARIVGGDSISEKAAKLAKILHEDVKAL